MTRAWLVILFGAAAGVSCNDPDIVPPTQLNLDRPVDVSFGCYGPMKVGPADGNGAVVITAQPPTWCNEYSPTLSPLTGYTVANPPKLPPGVEARPVPDNDADPRNDLLLPPLFAWYGFILQSASGTVALSRWEPKPSQAFATSVGIDVSVRDADPRTPAKNAISVGENPIAIATDLSGCHEITANAGSCDLSVLDINSAVAFDSAPLYEDGQVTPTPPIVTRKAVLTPAMTPIRARPAAMVIQPSAPDVIPNNTCSAAPTGLAYVAYPGCNLVAGVDLTTGIIQQAIKFTGTQATLLDAGGLATLTCNDECSGPTATTADLRPTTLDLRVDVDPLRPTRRLAIGAENSSTITVIDLTADTFAPASTPLQIALEDKTGKLGVTTVRLTPQIAMGNSTTGHRRNNNVTVGPNNTLPSDATPAQIALTDTFAAPADPVGTSIGGEGQYVYAVATDGTVRVVDVLNVRKECDTQVDMRFVRALATTAMPGPGALAKLQCFPVGDPTNPARRTDVKGPGIQLLGTDGVPTSVSIFRGLDEPLLTLSPLLDADKNPVLGATGNAISSYVESPTVSNQLIGYFAMITESSGHAYVVNIDDDDGPDQFDPTQPQATAPVLIMAHQLRDAFTQRAAVPLDSVNKCTATDPASAATGGPRASLSPLQIISPNTLSTDAVQGSKVLDLPSLRRQACVGLDVTPDPDVPFDSSVSDLQIGADAATRDATYPDLRSTRNDSFLVAWEGPLSNDTTSTAVDGPVVRSAQMTIDSQGIHVIDASRPYCEAGVEPFDIVQLRGCNPVNQGLDCPSGYSCFVHEDNKVTGLGACMLTSEGARLQDACKDFLTSARRYTVGRAESGELTLLPRKHVLPTTPLDGCVDNAQCQNLASYAMKLKAKDHPFALTGTTDSHAWQCRVDTQRAPVNGDPAAKRCVEVCANTDECDAGTVCIGATAGARDGTCMESVVASQSCMNGPQQLSIHASEAFTMIGSLAGYVHGVVERGGDGADKHVCEVRRPPGAVNVGRIPLHAPACAAPGTVDPATGALTGGGFEANPCSTTVTQVDDVHYELGTDAAGAPACVRVEAPVARQAPAIKVRTPTLTLTMVDPYSPGDAQCIGDRAAGLGQIPHIVPASFDSETPFGFNFRLSFDQRAGYTPLPLAPATLLPTFPVKVVTGPDQSIWIIDDGDFLATQVGQESTKGRVYRLELFNLTTLNVLQ